MELWRQTDSLLQQGHGCRLPAHIGAVQSGRPGAWIVRPATARSTDEHDEIRMSVGMLACLDDLICGALCGRQFMRNAARDDVEIAPTAVMVCNEQSEAHHFHDYSALFSDTPVEIGHVISGVPLDRERLAEGELLTSMAATFVYRHEQSHALFGHLDFLGARHAPPGMLALGDGADPVDVPRAILSSDERQCLELQADALAIELLLLEEMFESDTRPGMLQLLKSARANKNLSTRHLYSLQFASDVDIVRACLVSAACAIIVIDRAERAYAHNRSPDYPLPSTRLVNPAAVFPRNGRPSFGGAATRRSSTLGTLPFAPN